MGLHRLDPEAIFHPSLHLVILRGLIFCIP
jgi:hypothetical protein